MKKFLSLLVLVLLTSSILSINVNADSTPTAKAVLDSSGNNLVFYYDDLSHEGEGNVYNFDALTSDFKPFDAANILTATFDESFKGFKPTSLSYLFSRCARLRSVNNLNNLDTSNVTDMSYMFYGCESLQSLDLSNFNTSNVINMDSMFQYCTSLQSLDLSNFNTSNVENMRYMFIACTSLESLDVSKFDTSNVTNMDSMFYDCRLLQSLDVSSFDTSNVTNMNYMFYDCRLLQSLDVSNFNTSKVASMDSMFYYCSSLESLDLFNFNTSNVTNMNYMFSECFSLKSLDLSNFDTSKVAYVDDIFYECSALEELKVPNGLNERMNKTSLPMPASTSEHDNCFFMYDKQDNVVTYKACFSKDEMAQNSKSGTEDKVFTYKVLPKETLINDVTFVTKYLDKVTYESATSDKALNATLYPVSGTDDHNITYKNKNYLVGTNFDMSDTTVYTCDDNHNKKQSFTYTKVDNTNCAISLKDDYSKNINGTDYKYDIFLDETALDHSKYSVLEGSVKFLLPSSSLDIKTYSGKVLSNGGLSTFTLTVSEETKPTPKPEYKVLNTGVE